MTTLSADGFRYLGRLVKPGERFVFTRGTESVCLEVVELVAHARQIHFRVDGRPHCLGHGQAIALPVGDEFVTVRARVEGLRLRVAFGATGRVRFDRVRAPKPPPTEPVAADHKPIKRRRNSA